MDLRAVLFSPGFAASLGFTFLALIGAVVAHEIAHVVVGWATGLRVAQLRLGPLEIRDHVRPRVRLVPSLQAGVVLVPTGRTAEIGPLRWGLVLSTAAGPLVGIAIGAMLISLGGGQRSPATRAALEMAGQASLILGLVNLLPIRTGQVLADGRRLLALISRDREGAHIIAATLLVGEALSGRRPRDWDVALLALIERSPDEAFAQICLYEAALDRGEIESAGRHLDAALELRKHDPTGADAVLFNEAAYFVARHRKDPRTARGWLDLGARREVASYMRARSEAAVLCAEGRALEGRQCAVAGLAALERAHRRDGGPYREQLEELARGAGMLVRPLLTHAH